jgi:hypothetical protein
VAVPGIGVRLAPDFDRRHLDRVVEHWRDLGGDVNYPSPASVVVSDGSWRRLVDVSQLLVDFTYNVRLDQSGATQAQLATVHSPEPRAYSELLGDALRVVRSTVDILLHQEERLALRIGLFLNAVFQWDTMPPGVRAYADRLASTTGNADIVKIESQILRDLAKSENQSDRCHHAIVYDKSNDTNPDDVVLRLDWQRYYYHNHPKTGSAIKREIDKCAEEASLYFQKFGDGEE